MDESTEELKVNMEKAFAQRVEADQKLTALADHLNGGKGTYATAEDFAYRAGNVLSGVFRDNIKAETLENGVFTKEFVEGTIIPLLKDDHRIVSSMAAVAQENVNTAAGVHIRAQKADFNHDRADGFVTKMAGKTMEEAGWMLGSPVSNFSQSVVDETMQKNGEVLAKAGKVATIKREAEAKCCDWCLSKAGTYDAENREAYQRHRECRCVIEMHLGGSIKRQTDWKHNVWEERKAQIKKNVVMDYPKIERVESKILEAGGDAADKIISGKQVDFGDYRIGISDKLAIKPRELHEIEKDYIRPAIEKIAEDRSVLPTIVLADVTELSSAGRYVFDSNRLFLVLKRDNSDENNRNYNMHLVLHELTHWKDCQEIAKNNPGITEKELMPIYNEISKKSLDAAGVDKYNVNKYGRYAKTKYDKGVYYEPYVDYRVFRIMGRWWNDGLQSSDK